MNKRVFYLLFLILFLGIEACAPKNTYQIKGNAANAPSEKLYLERITQQSRTVIDTVTLLVNGDFSMKGNIDDAALYRLRDNDKKGVLLYLEPGSKVKVMMDFDDLNNYSVTGNNESERIKSFNDYFFGRNKEKQELFTNYQAETDSLRKAEYFNELNNWDQATIDQVKKKVQDEPNGIVAVLMIGAIPAQENVAFYNDFNKRLQLERPNSVYAREFNGVIDQLNAMVLPPAIGDTAPNISMANPEGKVLSLYDLKGDYVLLDFWAAWCGPCRKENPNVVKAYNEFKEDGFKVFNVSLDKTQSAWVKAIKQDKLDWPYHVSDLKSWNNAAAREYAVKSIPTNYLIDPTGKIIAKNLRGPALEAKLNEIFKK